MSEGADSITPTNPMAIVLLLAVVVPLFAIAGSNENQTELSNADIVKQCQELRLSASEYPACERAAAEELIKTQTVQHPTCGEDYYPAEALRLNQGGVVVARVCVGTNNRVDGPVEVIASSGVPELDEAATKCLAGGVYKAGTVNGVPARTCKDVKITFSTPSTVRAAADELFRAYDALAVRPDDPESRNARDLINVKFSGLCPLLAHDNKYRPLCMGYSADYDRNLVLQEVAEEKENAKDDAHNKAAVEPSVNAGGEADHGTTQQQGHNAGQSARAVTATMPATSRTERAYMNQARANKNVGHCPICSRGMLQNESLNGKQLRLDCLSEAGDIYSCAW